MSIGMIKIFLNVTSIVAFILFILVLIKQFRKGGILQGILGIITCGLWTFIWGWIKHNAHGLTRLMLIWTLIIVAQIAIAVVGIAIFGLQFGNMLDQAQDEIKAEIKKQKPSKGKINRKINRRAPARNPSPGKAEESDPQKLASAAMALWQDGRYADPERAVSNWTQVIQAQPKAAQAFNNRGVGHYNAGRYFEAISDYNQAIGLDPNYAVAFNNRGNARYAMGNFQEALADYAASLRLNPQYANAHSNRGLTHYRMNAQSKACEDFQKACELGDCEMIKWALSINTCK